MMFRLPHWQAPTIALATFCFWLAASATAGAEMPTLLAEKNWALGYILVGLCIFMGLLAICIPRLRRIEAVDEEAAPQQQAKGAPATPQRPGFAPQYGQPGYGQPGFGQPGQPRPAMAQAAPAHAGGGPLKSRKVAGLLGVFLGGWGIHRFYLGYSGIGAAMIIVTLCTGIGAWWGIIDGIMILMGGGVDRDGEGRPLGP